MSPGVRRLVCIFLLVLLLGSFVLHAIIQNQRHQNTEDFGLCYQAARAMLDGRDIYTSSAVHYIYPPFFAFAFQPFALLPEIAASAIWAIISAALLLWAVLIAAREAVARWLPEKNDLSLPWVLATIAIYLLADKIHAMFTLGQTDSITLLGFAYVLLRMERRPISAGIAVGVAANVKYLSLIFVPYFILKRNYQAAISSAVTFIFFLFLPAVEIGLSRLSIYLSQAFGGLAQLFALPAAGHPAKMYRITYERSLSFTSGIFRVTRFHHIHDVFAIGAVALFAISIMTVIVLLCRKQRIGIFEPRPSRQTTTAYAVTSLEWAILIFFTLTFSPQTVSRHVLLLVLVFPVVLALFLRSSNRRAKSLLLLSLFLVLAGLSLPLKAIGLRDALMQWRYFAGPSWCALVLTLVLVWNGSRTLTRTAK